MKRSVLVLLLCLSHAGAQGLRETASAWVDHYARSFGVPAEFVKAVIDVESGWQPNVIRRKGRWASCSSRRRRPSRSE